jgi:uncharacterized membrane protein
MDGNTVKQRAGVRDTLCLAGVMRIPSILRQDQSRAVHIGIAAAVGVAAAGLVGTTAGWRYAPAAGWIATAAVYLVWTWASIAKLSATAIEVVVQQRHPARRPADTIILLASVASLGGVGYLLVASNVKGPDSAIAAAVGFLSVSASWLAVHVVYTLRYAVQYYTEPVGGIEFNQDEKPTFADFAYVAFTIAVTYGVTDTTLKNRAIRVSALQQAMVSYLFGTVILAVTVQVIGTLSGL